MTKSKPVEAFNKLVQEVKDYKVSHDQLVITLKKELLESVKLFFSYYGKYVEEIFWIHRSSEYNDEGSCLGTGEVYFQLTEVANYLIEQTPDLRAKVFCSCDHHESTENFVGLAYNFNLTKTTTPLKGMLQELKKLQDIFSSCPDTLVGELFGPDTEVHIRNDGKVDIKNFDMYGE